MREWNISSCAASCSHIRHNRSPPSAAKHLKYKSYWRCNFWLFSSVYYYGFFMHCPPLPAPPFNPWWGNGDGYGTPSQASRCRRCCSVVGAADRKWVHHIDRFFSPRCVLHFFSVFLLATFFYAMWQRAVCEGGTGEGGGRLAWGRSGVVALYMCVCLLCVCGCVCIHYFSFTKNSLCTHRHTHTLLHRQKIVNVITGIDWWRWRRQRCQQRLQLSPFGPKKKKKNRREK